MYSLPKLNQGYRHWQNVNLIFHKPAQKEVKQWSSGDCRGPAVDPCFAKP
jgi:hypothetical protein